MSEPFTTVEEMIRGLARDVKPAVSLRQRVLTASRIARERQLRRIRIRQTSCWFLIGLCAIYAGAQVQWSAFPTQGSPNEGERFAASGLAICDSPGSIDCDHSEIVGPAEASSPVFNDPVEWEMAESHWRRRDRQSTLISHYF
jgi:hypothetical protein